MAGLPRPYGRYILEERLAMGGMAEIFRARTAQAGFEKRVCIKRVLPHFLEDEDFVTMFRDEARTAAKLQHANVVQVFDFGEVEDDGQMTLFLGMELVEGADLRRIVEHSRKKKIPFEIGEVTQIGIEVCRGLHHAHTLQENGRPLGIVHRDVSPHNIMVSRQGEVKVTDFGIARAAERATHTSTGIVKGKVAYMSPEQAEGKAFDHRLDQWAVGVVLWELLCGERLFKGENDVTILRKVMNVEVPRPSTLRRDVPGGLEDIVLRALSGEPEARFADLRQMELALSRFLFSGAVDPSTAEVRAVFGRIVDAGGEQQPKRTSIIDAAAVPPAPPAPQKTERFDDVASTQPPSTQSLLAAAPPDSDSGEDASAVFVSSGRLPAAPALSASTPSAPPSTAVIDDPALLEAAIQQFEKANSGVSPSKRNLASSPSPSPAAPREPSRRNPAAETVVAEGMLAAEAERVSRAQPAADVDGTPATRTLVPVSERLPAAPPPPAPVVDVATAALAPEPAPKKPRTMLFAAAGGLAAAAVVVVGVVANAGAPSTTPAPPPAPVTPTPPPPEPTPTPPEPTPTPTPTPTPVTATPEPEPTPAPTPVAPEPTPKTPTPTPAKPKATPPTASTTSTSTPPAAATPKKKPAEAEPAPPDESAVPGSVYIDVPGSWAKVSIGPRVIGDTPMTLKLAPGKYNITLENTELGKKKVVPVTITSGAKSQVNQGW